VKFQADFDLGVIPSDVQKIFASHNEALAKDANLTILKPAASGPSRAARAISLIKNEPNGLGVYKPNYLLEVASRPSATARNGSLRWLLRDSGGESGSITLGLTNQSRSPRCRRDRPSASWLSHAQRKLSWARDGPS